MISYKNENGNVKELAAQGSMKDLLAESAYLLTAIYSMLARRDKAVAEIFKVPCGSLAYRKLSYCKGK